MVNKVLMGTYVSPLIDLTVYCNEVGRIHINVIDRKRKYDILLKYIEEMLHSLGKVRRFPGRNDS